MSNPVKGGAIVAKSSSAEFTAGCEYQIEKVSKWRGLTMVKVYNDNGDPVSIEFPHDKDFGIFEAV